MTSRQGIQLDHRRALRRWAHQQRPRPTQKQCVEWFHQQYGHKLSQSTVSDSLSPRFSHLDGSDNLVKGKRLREGQWPNLEKVLFTWQQRVESKGAFTSGDILRLKAKEIWRELPQYSGQPIPEFSAGWLDGFKKRFSISSRTRHGEAASTPESAEEETSALQTIAGDFQDDDVYNMDESALFWRMMPSRGLASQPQAGIKKDKSRITITFCVNATGTDRLPIWFIGTAAKPRALRNVAVSTMGGEWRWNKKGWMTTIIMEQWLQAFYKHIGTIRRVLLTMDNFSAHHAAIESYPPPANIQVCWLPANSTSCFQPLDQGIIQNCKAYYKRHWLKYILQEFDSNANPQSTMNLHLALRWILRSWNNDVSNLTIYNCFRKSTLVTCPIFLTNPIVPIGLMELYDKVKEAGNIRDAMELSNFLNPAEEDIQGDANVYTGGDDDILTEVIEEHLGVQSNPDDDEAEQPKPLCSAADAKKALQMLIEFTEGQESLHTEDLRALERMEYRLDRIVEESLVQGTLDSWLR